MARLVKDGGRCFASVALNNALDVSECGPCWW